MKKQADWKHIYYEHWEGYMDGVYTKIEDHGKYGGYNIKINIEASSRGANCMEDEIDTIIQALNEAKAKVATLNAKGKDV